MDFKYAQLKKTIYNPIGGQPINAIRFSLQYGVGEEGRMDFYMEFVDNNWNKKDWYIEQFYSDFRNNYDKIDVYQHVKKCIKDAIEYRLGENPDTFLAQTENRWMIKGFDARTFEKDKFALYNAALLPVQRS